MDTRSARKARITLLALVVVLPNLAGLSVPLHAREAAAVPATGGQCNAKPTFGCERGAWSLDGHREATIAWLATAATYRVCVWDPPKGDNDIALNIVLDDETLTLGPGKRPLVLMPVLDTIAQPNDAASCVLLTGRHIKLVAAASSNPARFPRGYYERLGPVPFVGMQRIEAQPAGNDSAVYPIVSARPAGGAAKRLYRVCLGRFFGADDERPSTVRTDLHVDGTIIPTVNSSCVDVEGSEVIGETWGPAGGGREPAMSGLLAF